MFQTKFVEKNQLTRCMFSNIFLEIPTVYGITWKRMVKPGTPLMTM